MQPLHALCHVPCASTARIVPAASSLGCALGASDTIKEKGPPCVGLCRVWWHALVGFFLG